MIKFSRLKLIAHTGARAINIDHAGRQSMSIVNARFTRPAAKAYAVDWAKDVTSSQNFVSLHILVVQICPDGFFPSFPPLRQRAWATGLST